LALLNDLSDRRFSNQKEKLQYTPYFEICSPPPELI